MVTTLNRFRPCLKNKEFARLSIKPPFDIHWFAIVRFNGDRHTGQGFHLVVGQREAIPFFG